MELLLLGIQKNFLQIKKTKRFIVLDYLIIKGGGKLQDFVSQVRLAISGDHEAFQFLMKSQQAKMYKIAYSYAFNEEDALEIVQETFMIAFTSINKIKEPEYFSTWVIRILINCSLNFVKKKRRILALGDFILSKKSAILTNVDERIDLLNVIKTLNDKDKTVINLRFYLDYTIPEIASILGVPEGTVKTRLHRAIKKLGKRLDGKEGEYGKLFKQSY
jgi:RNA polymerase sigma-70 factor, ECF subfamily